MIQADDHDEEEEVQVLSHQFQGEDVDPQQPKRPRLKPGMVKAKVSQVARETLKAMTTSRPAPGAPPASSTPTTSSSTSTTATSPTSTALASSSLA